MGRLETRQRRTNKDGVAMIWFVLLLLCACDPDKPTAPQADASAEIVDPYGDGASD